MSANRGKKPPARQGKQPAAPPRGTATQVQPVSPLGLVLSIAAALAIAGILLFVINTRLNAARPAPAPTPAASAPAAPTSSGAASTGVTQLGSFAKGNAQAKVTVTEFSDFK